MKPKTTWKTMERTVARKFGTTRTPLSGGNSKMTRSDTLHPNLFIECKYRAKLPSYINELRIVKQRAEAESKIAMMVFKEKGQMGEFVLLELDDLKGFMSKGWYMDVDDINTVGDRKPNYKPSYN